MKYIRKILSVKHKQSPAFLSWFYPLHQTFSLWVQLCRQFDARASRLKQHNHVLCYSNWIEKIFPYKNDGSEWINTKSIQRHDFVVTKRQNIVLLVFKMNLFCAKKWENITKKWESDFSDFIYFWTDTEIPKQPRDDIITGYSYFQILNGYACCQYEIYKNSIICQIL